MSYYNKLPLEVVTAICWLREAEESWDDISRTVLEEYNLALSEDVVRHVHVKFRDYIMELQDGIRVLPREDLGMPELTLDMDNPHIKSVSKKVSFIDIETSLLDAKVFRTGKQQVNANQLTSTTKILTVAGGSMYDLYKDGIKGVWSYGNHMYPNFEANPLDDTEVLRRVWYILDNADVIVAHNARFDTGWLNGRFLELGWVLPSRYSVICSFANLYRYNMTSKKLDELSRNLVGTKKVTTDFDLWMRCSAGDKSAFEEMMEYNRGDIYDTLFKVYMRTCMYYPQKCVDFTEHDNPIPQCRTDGSTLEKLEDVYENHTTGLQYQLYRNPKSNIIYRDRYNTNSKKSGIGLIREHK
jgi:hypothetical protein